MLTRRALHDGGWFAVLMLQAVAIMVEDYVILVGRKLGVRESVWWKWLGGVWVVLWVGWSLAGQVGEMEAVSGGFGRVFAS